jgi:hypothetical protein
MKFDIVGIPYGSEGGPCEFKRQAKMFTVLFDTLVFEMRDETTAVLRLVDGKGVSALIDRKLTQKPV